MPALTPGFFPPHSDTNRTGPALSAPWLSNPMVADGQLADNADFVTAVLPGGLYYVYVSAAAHVNAGAAPASDPAAATVGARPKRHTGGWWPVAIRPSERISLRSVTGAADFQIFKGV